VPREKYNAHSALSDSSFKTIFVFQNRVTADCVKGLLSIGGTSHHRVRITGFANLAFSHLKNLFNKNHVIFRSF
jgi:hypothetical protein